MRDRAGSNPVLVISIFVQMELRHRICDIKKISILICEICWGSLGRGVARIVFDIQLLLTIYNSSVRIEILSVSSTGAMAYILVLLWRISVDYEYSNLTPKFQTFFCIFFFFLYQ